MCAASLGSPLIAGSARGKCRRDRFDRGPGIGDDPDAYREIYADLARLEVDLNQVGGDRHASPVGHDLGEAAADGEHGIGVGDNASGAGGASVSE